MRGALETTLMSPTRTFAIDAAPFPKRIDFSVSFFKDGHCIGYSPTA